MNNGWNRTPDPGPRIPGAGFRNGDRDRDGGRDRVRDRDRIHSVALQQPDPGLRTPDPESRTGSDTVTVTDTDTVTMAPVTIEPTIPFSSNSWDGIRRRGP